MKKVDVSINSKYNKTMSDEMNQCATCSHVHTKEDGTCAECECQDGKKEAPAAEQM